MKRYLVFCQLALLPTTALHAQIGTGTDGLFIQQGTQVSMDGLTLLPSADLTIASRDLTTSSTAVPGSPPSITRVYNFSQPTDFIGTVGMFYQPSELNTNTESLLEIAYGNPSFVTTLGSTVNETDHYISNELTSLTNISSVTAAQSGALPVTLVDFQVKRLENLTMLYWSTSVEKNSDFFEVQQSVDTKRWRSLGTVQASRESVRPQTYSFQDPGSRAGRQYYRLKMVDVDGSFAYSAIQSLVLDAQQLVSAYPNPVVDKLQIAEHVKLDHLKLTDLSGRSLLELSKPKSGQELNMKDFPSGMYLVLLRTTDGQNQVVKIIKQ